MFLIGDIGGTKVHLAYYDQDHVVKEEKFPNRHSNSFYEILKKFVDRPADKSYLALAGPIHGRKCHMTNLNWDIDADQIEKEYRVSKVHLINDLVAAGCGLKHLKQKDIFTLNEGVKVSGNQAIIAAGTGLGMGGLCWDGKNHLPLTSEGGHADFAPCSANDKQLWDYLHKKYGHVSIERVVSGPGLEHLYWFLVERGSCKTAVPQKIDDFDASSQGQQAGPCCADETMPEWAGETARRELAPKGRFSGVHEFCNCLERGKHKKGLVGEEISKQVIEQGLAGESKICGEVLQWFASLYGATAGNVALQFLSVGGIYLAGGIAPRILSVLKQGEFMKAFADKGRFQELLQKIPVHVVLNESLSLLGALELCLTDSLGA